MHACGHDIHTAALLAAAKIIQAHKDELKTNVVLIFQPDEEGSGGAQRLIDAGIFKKYNIRKVFGMHVRPELDTGTVAVKFGKSYAASDVFHIEVQGKSSHGAEPHRGSNALLAASHIVTSLDGLLSRNLDPTDNAVLSICTFESGRASNIIPDLAKLSGIIRTLGTDTRLQIREILKDTVTHTAEAFGCQAKVTIKESYPGVVNNNDETLTVRNCAEELFSKEYVITLDTPTMTTEDFGYYLFHAPGSFYHVGCGCEEPLHSPKFSPDERCLKTAVAMTVKLAFTV